MVARNRLPPWHEEVRLANGREVLIRPIRADDADPLRAAFDLLQPDEIRQRFLHTLTEMTPELARRLTQPNSRSEFALVAAEPLPPGEALIGAVARAAIQPDGQHAEFAILVSRYIAGMGLGRHLLRRIVRWAKGKRLQTLYGDVLESNQPMLALVESLGFRRETAGTPGLIRVVLELAPALVQPASTTPVAAPLG